MQKRNQWGHASSSTTIVMLAFQVEGASFGIENRPKWNAMQNCLLVSLHSIPDS